MTLREPFGPVLGQHGSLAPQFAAAANETKLRPSAVPDRHSKPFSIRLTAEERQQLRRAAGGVPLGSYIRSRLLLDVSTKRRLQRAPVQDQAALARVLGQLGQSHLASNLNQLAKAANMGALPVTPEVEAELHDACEQVRAMRQALMRALGLHDGAPR